jgi:thioredoxin 1
MAEGVLEINDNSLYIDVLQADKPVLVYFWAPWFGPCNSVGPVVEKLAEAWGEQFDFARCNVDNNPKMVEKLGIKGIPTLMFSRGGKLVDKLIGMVPKSTIEDVIKKCLSGSEMAKSVIVQ